MKTGILGATLALGAASLASAQDFDASRTMQVFTTGDLEATLARLAAEIENRPDSPNTTVTFSNGLVADARLMACQDEATATGCLGTSILINYATPDNVTADDVRDGIDEYNYRQNFGRAYLDPDGGVSVRLYLIADGGISMENYRQQIGLFSLAAAKLPDYVLD